MSDITEPAPIDLPEGLWSQPAVDTSAIEGLADVEAVQLLTVPAKLTYDYTPGIATTRFLARSTSRRASSRRCRACPRPSRSSWAWTARS